MGKEENDRFLIITNVYLYNLTLYLKIKQKMAKLIPALLYSVYIVNLRHLIYLKGPRLAVTQATGVKFISLEVTINVSFNKCQL